MKSAYRTKRLFWHNLKNFDAPNVPFYGIDEIIAAGFEFILCDSNCHLRNIFVAVNSLNDSCMFYEVDNNKIGAMCGDATKIFVNVTRSILNAISELTYNMDQCKHLPACPKFDFVNFYALGRKGNGLMGSEEKDIFDKMKTRGMRFMYLPKMILHHIIPQKKLEPDYFNRLTTQIGISERQRTKAIGKGKYINRLFKEAIKWGGTLVLLCLYTISFHPAKGWKLVQFRHNVTKGLLTPNNGPQA